MYRFRSSKGIIQVLLRSTRNQTRPGVVCSLKLVPSVSIHRYSSTAPKKAESFEFQAETKSLLDIVAKSLYSNQEVRLFFLIANLTMEF